ncbi:hypothetical protein Poli38472_004088 [Pythium oligandrum]|uniref:Uncharacterized protein n=1 Tax=Pythium oligandrum TaxID=41045 RepID=A0A8K1CQ39_PYTOL|nr:hypothetical protein Poli38472_004088 [Pythium oligandrum]|eukprot:TMW66323.1 hypothetical protein Poli38472_004088 [Pythium oligandrum]
MTRTGRELTLFGIYGEPKGLKTTKPTKEKPRCRPIRPITANTKFSPRHPLSKSEEESKQVSEQTTAQEEAAAETEETVEKCQRDEEDICVEAPVVRDLPVEQVEAVRAETSATGRAARSPVRRYVPTDQQSPSTVVSVYGDGFIEVLPHESSLNHLTGPFSIKMRIFKAADELNDLAQVQSEESRHQHPELNDDGTFVRWSCCGSCDPNVYGCPVASSAESGNMPIEETLRLFPPRLLAVKQAKPDTDDTLSFIIFDRGVPNQTATQNLPTAHAGCRVWWRGYECWANRYDVPSNQWLDFAIVFDGRSSVVIPLHSMLSTSYFPNVEDIRNKIISVVSHEARRSPGEEVHQQAFRYFLALAEQSRDSRERTFLEAVMNRRVVITEKRIASEFQRIGFHVAWHELHELIRCFKTLQDNYMRNQHRIEDIPSMSLSKPSPEGAYSLPLLRQVSYSSIAPCNPESGKAKWRFTAVFLDYDLQLLDFVHDGCPTSPLGSATYTQGRYLNGGFVDRVNTNLAELPSNVYCILFSLVSERGDGMQPNTKFQKPPTTVTRRPSMKNTQQDGSNGALPIRLLTPDVLVQFENLETYHCLSRFKVRPSPSCRWFTLAALYRSRKANLWRLQALGTSGQANTIHTSLEELNTTLVEKRIVQVYEVVILYDETDESSEFFAFAKQFSRNIRFGRNGRIVINGNREKESRRMSVLGVHGGASLDISLSLLTHGTSVTVYRHDKSSSTLPTIQSICRNILRILAEHGIKESLQQNPFGATSKNAKRMVNIRVMSDQSNTPIRNAHVFVEKSLNNLKIATSLASKIVPTLTMGSRLVSIRKRLQKKKYLDEVTTVATEMIAEVIRVGLLNTYILLHRESRLMPVVRARAMLKRVMRRRYEWNKQRILARVDESERSRIYSRSKPIRLQQLYRFELQLSKSEKDLLIDFSTLDEQSLRLHFGLTATVKGDSESVDQIWHSQLRPAEEPTEAVKKPEESKKPDKENPTANQDSESGPQIKQKRSSLTDEHGVVTCRLAPGSYSVYIFHADYFEWTSLIVIFPSINASGLYGGSISSLAPQEIVVPLEEYRWAYSVQLVDFYQQKTTQPVGDVPLVITDKCTPSNRSSRLIKMGVLLVVLGSVFGDVGAPAEVRVLKNDGTVQERDGEKYGNALAKKIQSMEIGSSCMFQLRVGTYHVHVVADGLYASNQLMKVSWNAAPLHVRHLVVLCPEFKDENEFRLVFSCVNATASMDTILEVYDNGKLVRSHWQHDVSNVDDGVIFHGAHVLANCAYQTFSLTCRRGISYRMKIASSVCAHALIGSARPRIQVYTSCGLLFNRTLEDDEKWIQDFYWSPCGWDEHGVFHAEDESKEACDPK